MVRSHVTHRKTRQQAGTLFMQLRFRLVWLVRSEQNFIWNESQKFRVGFFCVHLCLSVPLASARSLLHILFIWYTEDDFMGIKWKGNTPLKAKFSQKQNLIIQFVLLNSTTRGLDGETKNVLGRLLHYVNLNFQL